MSDDRELIRSRLSLVEIIGRDVRLQRKGKHWTGLCPFHEDRNPSFTVSEERGFYKCWACGASGDLFKYVQETQKLTFREAMDYLAKLAGIELQAVSPEASQKRSSFQAMMTAAQGFFVEHLQKSKEGLAYCEDRGLNAEIREMWGLGFAPAVEEAMPAMLQRSGFSLAMAKELFLVDGDEGRGYSGKFKSRLMFPIYDHRGSLVAFGGRILGQGIPKYINSSDTPLYSKRRVLYGMNRAKGEIANRGRAVLVEGYLDVIACHRAGVQEAVASLGTSLSEEHVKQIGQWAKEVVVLYDADEAGQKAARRAVEMFEEQAIRVKVALMPPGQDPDSLLRHVGPEAVVRAATAGLTPTEFRLAQLSAQFGLETEEYWTELVLVLAQTDSELELVGHVERLAPQYPGIRDPLAARSALMRQVKLHRHEKKQATVPTRAAVQMPEMKIPGRERVILAAFEQPEFRSLVWDSFANSDAFESTEAKRFAETFRATWTEPPAGSIPEWVDQLEPEGLSEAYLNFLMTMEEPLTAEMVRDAVAQVEQRAERRKLREAWEQGNKSDAQIAEIQARLGAHQQKP